MPTIQEQKVLFHILTNYLGEGATPPHNKNPLNFKRNGNKEINPTIRERQNCSIYT